MRGIGGVLLGLLLALSAPRASATPAEDLDALRDGYDEGDFGRVRFLEGGAAIRRGSPENEAEAGDTALVNTPVFPGDAISTLGDQRAEIQLASGTLVRLDGSTQVEFQALPSPAATPADNAILKVFRGTLQISGRFNGEGDFRVDTPAASVFLLGSGDVRIDVGSGGRTRVQSRRGVAEVSCSAGSVLVRGGMRAVVQPGSVPEDPRPFSAFALDEFDVWVAERDAGPADSDATTKDLATGYRSVPEEIRPYYLELAAFGTWSYLPTYGYVWYPHMHGDGWRPYFNGYWHYGPAGYFWVSSEPWGWAPYHYGRWSWVSGHGWCWIPGSVFAGAWVSWSWGTSYMGWCPLDFWNRPALLGPVYYAGVYDPLSWTFVRYDHIVARDCGRHAVPPARLEPELRANVVLARPPRVAPRALARDASTREVAFRTAAEGPLARTAPVTDHGRAGHRTFAELEQAARRRASPDSRSQASHPDPKRSARGNVRRETPYGQDASRGSANQNLDLLERRDPEILESPRRGTTPSRRDTDTRHADRSSQNPVAEGLLMPGTVGEGRDPKERVRDLYRRMASPRVTRERGTGPPDSAPHTSAPSSSARARNNSKAEPPPVTPPRSARSRPVPTPKAAARAPDAPNPRGQSGGNRGVGEGGKKK